MIDHLRKLHSAKISGYMVCMCVCKYSFFMYVCFVFALVRKNNIVLASEVKPLINQSINQDTKRVKRAPPSNYERVKGLATSPTGPDHYFYRVLLLTV